MNCEDDLLNLQDLNINRLIGEKNVRGVVEKTYNDYEYKANIQPYKDLNKVKEIYGEYPKGAILILSYDEVKMNDVVTYDDREWEVIQADYYPTILKHYEAIAVLRKCEK